MRRDGQEPLLEMRYLDKKSLEPPAGEAVERGEHQRFGAVGVSFVVGQSEEIPGKEKPGDLPPAIAQQLIDRHRPRSDGVNVLGGICLIEYRAMRLDIDGAHDCCEAFLLLGGQCRTCREFACSAGVARRGEMQRMGFGSNSQAERRYRVSRVIWACRATHRTTPAVSVLPRCCHRCVAGFRLQPFESPDTR